MITLYFKQAWQMIGQNRLVSALSIAGTALSVAAVMLIVLIYQVNYGSYAPETHRYRMLYVSGMSAHAKTLNGGLNNGRMSLHVLRECFYTLKTPQAVTGVFTDRQFIQLPGQKLSQQYRISYTDAAFWTVFDFHFVAGAPFTSADLQAKAKRIVISASTARKLFGTTDAAGRLLRINSVDYRVSGVVTDVSRSANSAYADAWMPYIASEELMTGTQLFENTVGPLSAYLLARSSDDFPAIRQELKGKLARFNSELTETRINFVHGPYTQWDRITGANDFQEANLQQWLLSTGGLVLFLLLLPAFNIIGITLTQFRKRRGEIGIRKSFGAHFSTLITQVLAENLLISFLGGIIGLFLSYVLLYGCRSILFNAAPDFSMEMLFQPLTFACAFVFTLLMNLLSAGWPAYKAARLPVVKALNDIE
ncbi:MAG: FtsX-like permease family protein [Bacteroides sp.]